MKHEDSINALSTKNHLTKIPTLHDLLGQFTMSHNTTNTKSF